MAHAVARHVENSAPVVTRRKYLGGEQVAHAVEVAVREVVSRTLHSFKEADAICLNGRTVTIRDRGALCRIAEGA